MNYRQSDVILTPFPFSDLSSSKKRPSLVVSADTFNESSQDIVCCMITTNPKTDDYTVSIKGTDAEDGELHFNSTVKPHRLFTIDKKIVVKRLCSIRAEKFNEVIYKLQTLMPKIVIADVKEKK